MQIRSLEELKELGQAALTKVNVRTEEMVQLAATKPAMRKHIMVCGGTGCISSSSDKLIKELRVELKKADCDQMIDVVKTGCFGFCGEGPIIKVYPDDVFYVRVQPSDAKEIVEKHILKGESVERLLYVDPQTGKRLDRHHDMAFYQKQHRIALRNCGVIDPGNVEEYIAFRGYEALGKVLTTMSPNDVVMLMKESGLRGRGGGGFPTGLKWEITLKQDDEEKYIICNADEGDPGAFMDRSILEGDPHSVIEAMAIGGYATGAKHGMVYIRAEYPLAIERLRGAIEDARQIGLLGKDIFESGFDFDIQIKLGAGAFVCGEETALIHSIEGSRGEPTKKPPFPSESGYLKKPTTVNNVETYANVPPIILNGPEWFASIGTETSKGTKVFALVGNVNNVGLVEVPMGTTLREIIYDIGEGIKDGKGFKAVQTGGPSGGVITAQDLDTPIDYESLKAIDSMMGSGGMVVMDDETCMVNIAKFYLEFTQEESCGKCTPCRVGTKRMHELLVKITEGEGTMEDLDHLDYLARMISDTALCGLGQTAPNPIISTMRFFKDEYVQHVKEKKCIAGECKALAKYSIDPEKCIGCTKCKKVCPTNCITGNVKEVHVINPDECIACGACYEACKFDAIIKP